MPSFYHSKFFALNMPSSIDAYVLKWLLHLLWWCDLHRWMFLVRLFHVLSEHLDFLFIFKCVFSTDLVGLLVGSTEMLSSENKGSAVSGSGGAANSGDVAEEKMNEQFDNTFLHGVTYLGCSRIDNTIGAEGALSVMLDLKREAMSALPVTLAVPTNSHGQLRWRWQLIFSFNLTKYYSVKPNFPQESIMLMRISAF